MIKGSIWVLKLPEKAKCGQRNTSSIHSFACNQQLHSLPVIETNQSYHLFITTYHLYEHQLCRRATKQVAACVEMSKTMPALVA